MIDARELIDRHAVAFAACDWAAVKEFWHPEAELVSPGGSWPVSEMEGIMAGLSRDYDDIVIEVIDAFYSPDKTRLALEWTYASTRLSDGERTSPDAIMVDLRDGLIIRWREYFDSATSV